jgi:hypothetical protein
MIGRDGKFIMVGWAEHEIHWLQAAMTLKGLERLEAYRDISAMTGRPVSALCAKVDWLRAKARQDAIVAEARARRVMIAARTYPVPQRAPWSKQERA